MNLTVEVECGFCGKPALVLMDTLAPHFSAGNKAQAAASALGWCRHGTVIFCSALHRKKWRERKVSLISEQALARATFNDLYRRMQKRHDISRLSPIAQGVIHAVAREAFELGAALERKKNEPIQLGGE